MQRQKGATCYICTRFKDPLLSLLPEWSEFSRENKGRKDIYISHKVTVADELAKKHKFQSCQAETLILMCAAMIIHKLCLESQESFNSYFSANCLTRVATIREKVREKNIFSRSWKSHGILLQVSENELF